MTKTKKDKLFTPESSRRTHILQLGAAFVTIPLSGVLGCSEKKVDTDSGMDAGQPLDSGPSDSGQVSDAGEELDASDGLDSGNSEGEWATGGTANISENYDNPFGDIPNNCQLICETTKGPCFADSPSRRDISEAVLGLPTKLMLKIVDTDCRPVSDADIDIWHVAPNGLYSGDIIDFCTTGNSEAQQSSWFRGTQKTDSSGQVEFNTCFPGWYPGRAVHIHFTIRLGKDEYSTSQLYFRDNLINDIYRSHQDYVSRGAPDTTNARDTIIPESDVERYTLDTQKMDDGVLMAFKHITIRGSLDQAACRA